VCRGARACRGRRGVPGHGSAIPGPAARAVASSDWGRREGKEAYRGGNGVPGRSGHGCDSGRQRDQRRPHQQGQAQAVATARAPVQRARPRGAPSVRTRDRRHRRAAGSPGCGRSIPARPAKTVRLAEGTSRRQHGVAEGTSRGQHGQAGTPSGDPGRHASTTRNSRGGSGWPLRGQPVRLLDPAVTRAQHQVPHGEHGQHGYQGQRRSRSRYRPRPPGPHHNSRSSSPRLPPTLSTSPAALTGCAVPQRRPGHHSAPGDVRPTVIDRELIVIDWWPSPRRPGVSSRGRAGPCGRSCRPPATAVVGVTQTFR
jgi:hypothetical protein